MGKVITKTKDDAATAIAKIFNVTASYVRMVANGKRKNEKILEAYQTYKAGKNRLIKNIDQSVKAA